MTQPSQLVEPELNRANQNDQDMHMLPALDGVKPCHDSVPVNVEVAMEWAFLGGD
jgi:hypothetical protein